MQALLDNTSTEPSEGDILKKDNYYKEEVSIDGVPFFLFNGYPGFSGAQDPETFIRVFRMLKQKNLTLK